jgi:asparagine synthase (glutamine-hydrolysing)
MAAMVTRLMTGRPGVVPPQTRWGKLGDVLATRGKLLDLYQFSYGLFTPDFQRQLAGIPLDGLTRCGLPNERFDALDAMVRGNPTLYAISMLELSSFIGERLLRDTDVASMAVGLEVRVPLLDHVLIERASEVASDLRFEPLGRKMLLRRLALDGVDPAIFDRPKSGFELPFDRWCRDGLKDEMASTFDDAALCASVGLSKDSVTALWKAFQDGAAGLYWSRVWSVYALLWWCRQYDVKLK